MKKFLKMAAVLAALTLALSCFAGCKNNSKGEEKNPDDDYTVEGPWEEVTDLDDLVGIWVAPYKEYQERSGFQTFADKKYAGKWIDDVNYTFEFTITKDDDNNYIWTKYIIKKDSYSSSSFIFSDSLTKDEIAAIKAEAVDNAEDDESLSTTITVTKNKYVINYTIIKDIPDSDFSEYVHSLKLKNGKCYAFTGYDVNEIRYEFEQCYFKINKAKDGLQFYYYYDDIDKDKPWVTAKKQ